MNAKTEMLKLMLTKCGGDVNALPDEMTTTIYEAIITACGGNVADLPDRLESTYLKFITENLGNASGGNGGSSDSVELTYYLALNSTNTNGYIYTPRDYPLNVANVDTGAMEVTNIDNDGVIEMREGVQDSLIKEGGYYEDSGIKVKPLKEGTARFHLHIYCGGWYADDTYEELKSGEGSNCDFDIVVIVKNY